MQLKKFEAILSQAKNQFNILVNNELFYINTKNHIVMNDLGIVAIKETTGSPSIVFIKDIESVIVDGQKISA